MIIALALILYGTGVILAYGRLLGSFAAIDEEFIELPPTSPDYFVKTLMWLSWLAFLTGTILYITEKSKRTKHVRFLRFSMKDVWQRHRDNPLAQSYYRHGLQ